MKIKKFYSVHPKGIPEIKDKFREKFYAQREKDRLSEDNPSIEFIIIESIVLENESVRRETFTFKISPEERRIIVELAKKENRSMSSVVRAAIDKYSF